MSVFELQDYDDVANCGVKNFNLADTTESHQDLTPTIQHHESASSTGDNPMSLNDDVANKADSDVDAKNDHSAEMVLNSNNVDASIQHHECPSSMGDEYSTPLNDDAANITETNADGENNHFTEMLENSNNIDRSIENHESTSSAGDNPMPLNDDVANVMVPSVDEENYPSTEMAENSMDTSVLERNEWEVNSELESNVPLVPREETKSGKNLMKERLSLPYFILPKAEYSSFSHKLANNLDPASKLAKFKTHALSVANPSNEKNLSSGTVRKDLKQKLLEQIMEKKEAAFHRHQELQKVYDEENYDESEMSETEDIINEDESSSEDIIENDDCNSVKDACDSTSVVGCDNYDNSDCESDSNMNNDEVANGGIEFSQHKKNSDYSDYVNTNPGCVEENYSSGCTQDGNPGNFTTNLENTADSSLVCFSLPSYQPGGGFVEKNEETSKAVEEFSDGSISEDSYIEGSKTALGSFPGKNVFAKNSTISPHYPTQQEIFPRKICWNNDLLDSDEPNEMDNELFNSLSAKNMCSGVFNSSEDVSNSLNNFPDSNSKETVHDDLVSSEDEKECERKETDKNADLNLYSGKYMNSSEDMPTSLKNYANSDPKENVHDNLTSSEDEKNDSEVNEMHCEDDDDEQNSQEGFAVDETEKRETAQDFLDVEAELSGEDSSDEDDAVGSETEQENNDDFDDVPDDVEVLRNQIGTLHAKQVLDDDNHFLKKIQSDFLKEGDLFTESTRRKKFSWDVTSSNFENQEENGSDSEVEDALLSISNEEKDKRKWVEEKADSHEDESDIVVIQNSSLKMNIVGKSNVSVIQKKTSLKRKRGSLINSESILQNVKKSKEEHKAGSTTRKHIIFVKNDSGGPSPSSGFGMKASSAVLLHQL